MSNGFQETLDHIRSIADSEAHKGRLFERLMKAYFTQDPLYKERFSNVWLLSEWAEHYPGFGRPDIGIDLVAEERDGGYCAIQCKCHAPGTRISKPALDSFIAASAREPFSARMVVDTGDGWGPNALKTIDKLRTPCTVLRFGDLASRSIDWPDLVYGAPEDLSFRREPFHLRPHQQAAFDDVTGGFERHDRGKLIMACGTGKTFTALRIAEATAGIGGRVLYLVPSISLFQQSMREWADQQTIPHRYIGICSDTRAGRMSEDAALQELEIPVTTDPAAISKALQNARSDALTVVFCTYHSLGLVEQAQDGGAPAFDIAICDEAHRTTGVERPDDTTSPFVLIHNPQRIRAGKRLYMTATPRLYTESARQRAASHDTEVFSMDDPEIYGPEFHRLPFSRAVERDLLSDYRVLIFAVSEEHHSQQLQEQIDAGKKELNVSDTAKIVGCWRALQNPEGERPLDGHVPWMKRAIAFTNTIMSSKRFARYWSDVVERTERNNGNGHTGAFRCETRHVDGQNHALDRKARIEWLKGDPEGACRILSNARCLSEGIDVPALDAVLFMSPKSSQVDIVQAVGRAMRKAEGKTYGYIVLPVTIPPGVDPADALNNNQRFGVVWSVLRALRSHDDRFDAEINSIDLNKRLPPRVKIGGDGFGPGGDSQLDFPFPMLELPAEAIYAKIVEKCGDRKYWATWAKDVADIFSRLVHRIENLLSGGDNEILSEWFNDFEQELKVLINDSITRSDAIEMMAQHILTQPVFNALFEGYEFAKGNPVAQALDKLRGDFGEFGLEQETRDLERFYESVRRRAQGLDNSEARQRVLMELYEHFFATAMKKDADRLGIVYTPPEIVDFILNSAEHVLCEEFGRSLSDEGVHVLDPFTGTGIFLVRLLQSGLIRDSDLERKYHHELHANEIVLLAYYIAAIHIEEAFHGRRGLESDYEPFDGIVLTDTFNLHTDRSGFPKDWLPDNSARVERQQKAPIQVVVGNPPWSGKQRSSADENPTVNYPEIEKRVRETYASRSRSTNKNVLYNTYKMAIRWASDRIGEQGVVTFVTSGSYIDSNVDSGVRACLAEEFSSVYVLNLRGDARTSGELRRSEGDNAFGQGSREAVAITILVRNPKCAHQGCRILYRDIGDYLKRKEKLQILGEAGSIAGIKNWRTIAPDQHHDWVGQRSEAFQMLYPMGTKGAKAEKADDAIFVLFSNGYKTGRDAYIYNFSRDACAVNARMMVGDYLGALRYLEQTKNEIRDVDEIARHYASNVRWDQELKNNLKRRKLLGFKNKHLRTVAYRPFVATYCYGDHMFAQRKYQIDRIFPDESAENRAICVPGVGSTKPFSALVIDLMPDLNFLAAGGQCFPRYRYQKPPTQQGTLDIEPVLERLDNISDTALRAFRAYYHDNTITNDTIFDYIYGVLQAPAYREQFRNDLVKELPRIPFSADFHAFAEAGRELAKLHLGYETCKEYPLEVGFSGKGEPQPEHYRLERQGMKLNPEKTTLRVNPQISLTGIPAQAHSYYVNGRTPLEWFIDRYKIKTDKNSGIVNDPNGWFDHPEDLVAAIRRITHVSVETARIVAGLPDPGVSEMEMRQ